MKIFCPLCKKPSSLFFRTKDYNRKITRETFYYYSCPLCKLIFLSPIPVDMGKYYPDTYYAVPSSYEQLEKASQGERYKINIVQQFVNKGRLLEIGPAYGGFTFLAKQAGFEVEALEMDRNCCKFLQDVVGIKTINSNDPAEDLRNSEKYNVIALWHVIEHLPAPWKTLKAISGKLLPGGILVIAAPNPDAFQFHILGRFWPHVDAPRHLSLIPLSLLQHEIGLFGLKTIWSTTSDKGTLGWNIFGWEVFFSNLASRGFFRKNFRRIGWAISKLVAPIERINGLGSAYTAVFMKER